MNGKQKLTKLKRNVWIRAPVSPGADPNFEGSQKVQNSRLGARGKKDSFERETRSECARVALMKLRYGP